MTRVELAEMTWSQAASARDRGAVMLITIGTQEENGSVCPLATDTLAHEDEVAKWFSWPIEKALLGELVRAGRLARAGPGWLAAP